MPPLPAPDRSLLGRDVELRHLVELMREGAGAAVLLGGDAGVGKSALLVALIDRARAAQTRVLLGHCLDLGDSAAPYLPWTEMFARLAIDDPETAATLLAQHPGLSPVLPMVAPEPAVVSPAALFAAVQAALAHLAAEHPLLVLVEDAHWADRSTRELLTALFSRGVPAGVTVVVTYRADDLHRRHPLRAPLGEWTRSPRVERVMLAPLDDDVIGAIVHALAPRADAPPIVARAAGNPFFAEELAAAGRLGREQLPEDLADLLLVRADALPEAARRVVRAASAEPVVADSSGTPALTAREHEVLRLVADGLSNGEVAARLFVTTKTVSVHVSNILAKFGAANRTEAAALARRAGLLRGT